MNHTENYQLNQWDASDYVRREDFNEDNRKIEEAIAGLAESMSKIVFGSYTGTGTYGQEHPNIISFDFSPKIVVVFEDTSGNYYTIFLPGENHYHRSHSASNQFGYILVTSLNENRLSYYGTTGYSGSNAVSVQGNRSGTTYYYLAIG